MTKRNKARAANRLAEFEAQIPSMLERGFTAQSLDPDRIHWRVELAHGETGDYWPSTRTWMILKGPNKSQGKDLNVLLLRLEKIGRVSAPVSSTPDVTIFADASLCPKTKAGGWGAWMKRNGGDSFEAGGQLRDLAPTSSHAEACALANAIHIGIRQGHLQKGDRVLLQSDNLAALCAIAAIVPGALISDKGGAAVTVGKRSKLKNEPCIQSIRRLAIDMDLTVVVRHVRGHQQGDGRNWVNRRCDELAKIYMRKRRLRALAQAETDA